MESRLSEFAANYGFDTEQYIKNQLKNRNETAIHELQQFLEESKEMASSKLKNSVFQNYPQFIDASNQIANMEGDLLQLRNLLTELRTVIKGLGDVSSVATSAASCVGTLSAKMKEPAMPDRVRRQELQAETQWAMDALYDLDVLIAERKFDEAVLLIEDTRSRARSYSSDASEKENVLKGVSVRAERLAERLLVDLPTPLLSSNERRNIVSHLAGLGKIEKARDAYLAARSKWIRQRVRSIKFEGDVSEYSRELSIVVTSQLVVAVDDFKWLFRDAKLMSSFVMWVSHELEKYADSFARQVFHTDNFRLMAECLDSAYSALKKLEEKGLSMRVLVEKYFQPHLILAVESYCARIQQSVEKRVENETWRGRPLRIQDGQGDKDKEKDKDSDLAGDTGGKSLVVKLTDSAKYLYLASHRMISDMGRILGGHKLYSTLGTGLSNILEGYLNLLSESSYSGKLNDAQSLAVVGDAFFVVEDLLPRVSRQLQRRFGHALPSLDRLRHRLSDAHSAMRDSFSTHRAHLLLDEIQWKDGFQYTHDPDIERDIRECDMSSPGDHGVIMRPSKSFVHLIEVLCHIRASVARYVGVEVLPPIMCSIILEIAGRLDDNMFWRRNDDLTKSSLHQLVLDMRFILSAFHPYTIEASMNFVEGMIGKGVMKYFEKAKKRGDFKPGNIDPTTMLLDDAWFDLMVDKQLHAMKSSLADQVSADLE